MQPQCPEASGSLFESVLIVFPLFPHLHLQKAKSHYLRNWRFAMQLFSPPFRNGLFLFFSYPLCKIMLISNSPKRGTTVRDISNGSLVLTFKTCQQASLASVKVAEKKVRSSALIGQTLFLSFSCLGDFIWTITFTVLKPNLENDSPFFQLNRLCKICAEMESLRLAEAPEHLSNTAVLPPTSRGPLGANWGESCTGVRYARLHPCQGAVSRDWQPRRDAGAEPGSASIAARVLRILGAVTVCFFHSLTFTFETSLHVNVEEKKKCWSASFKSRQRGAEGSCDQGAGGMRKVSPPSRRCHSKQEVCSLHSRDEVPESQPAHNSMFFVVVDVVVKPLCLKMPVESGPPRCFTFPSCLFFALLGCAMKGAGQEERFSAAQLRLPSRLLGCYPWSLFSSLAGCRMSAA